MYASRNVLNPTPCRRAVSTATLLAAAAFGGGGALGCRGEITSPITVGQLAALLKSSEPPRLFDANGDSTRKEYGIIPGAVLLPSSRSYTLSLLPAAKTTPLVFYCASSWCGAAETAATRAARAGYRVVHVLPEGVKGWAEAGMPTEKPGGAGAAQAN